MASVFRRPAILLAFLLAIALFLSACGGSTKTVTTTATVTTTKAPTATLVAPAVPQQAVVCPPGKGTLGCAVLPPSEPLTPLHAFLAARAPAAPLFPDVSSFQPNAGWGSVRSWQLSNHWPTGGIFKMGEAGFRDPQAAVNAAALHSLKMWSAGYWFVRNIGCAAETNDIIAAARALGQHVIVLDLEVREAAGYGACLSPPLKRAGFVVVEYTAPGTNPGGVDTSDPLWIATYGPSFGCIWTCHPVAWQFTDGTFGATVFVPGIGRIDVNADFGISKLGGPPPPPPDPFALMEKAVRSFGRVRISEHQAASTWKSLHCLNPVLRRDCKTTRVDLVLLTGRLWAVAHNPLSHGHATWGLFHRGARFKVMWNDLHQTK